MFTTLGAFLSWAEKAFIEADLHFGHGTNNAWDEAVALALFVLHLAPDVDDSVIARPLTSAESEQLQGLAERRIRDRTPVPYLTHTAWFAGYSFYVNEHVLIPRSPIAELIDQSFSPWYEGAFPPTRILDLCTGSACIAIAIAKAFPNTRVDAIDIDENALSVARMNIVRHGVEDQVFLIQSDLFSVCKGIHYDIIVSNPPYVAKPELEALPQEYRHEPRLALDAGEDGLAIVHQILREAPKHLSERGILIVEVGSAEERLMSAYPDTPFTWLEFERGWEGVFLLQKGEGTEWKPS